MDRNTIQRSLIKRAVYELDHPTAEEVYDFIAKMHPTVGKCTIYRNLNRLSENGELLHISLPDSPDRFDKTVLPHLHSQCGICGRLGDVDMAVKRDLLEDISNTHGFEVTGYEILFSGICAECSCKKEHQ